MKLRW